MTSESKKPPVLEVVKGAKSPKATQTKPTGSGGGTGNGSKKAVRFGEYGIESGAFVQFKMMRIEGSSDRAENSFPLCDFTCRVVEEVIADDGLTDTSFLRVEGRRADGVVLPLVDIPAKAFYATQGNFANEYWGTLPFIYPGNAKKDNLRACIQLYSRLDGDIPRRNIYRYTGWKKINDEWQYLTGSGAISAAGLVDGVQVDLAGNLSKYQMPEPIAGEGLKAALMAALKLLDVCPDKPQIGASLLAMVLRAPLSECSPVDFVLWLHGLTGSRKSSVAKLALGFFGLGFTAQSERNTGFPGNWLSSPKAVAMQSFTVKDAVFIADDYKYTGSSKHDEEMSSAANELIMAIGNGAARVTLRQDRTIREGAPCRGALICTGEDTPKTQSTLARMLTLEVVRGDVCEKTLTELQTASNEGQFVNLMSAYLKWLAANLDRLKVEFPALIVQLTDSETIKPLSNSHPRAPGIFANSVAAVEVFGEFIQAEGLMELAEISELEVNVEKALLLAFENQRTYQDDQDPCLRFIELIQTALASGDAHLPDKNTQHAPKVRPYACGWVRSGSGDDDYQPSGKRIGWFDPPKDPHHAKVYLIPDAALEIAQSIATRQRQPFFGGNSNNLWRLMMHREMIQGEKNKSEDRPYKRKAIAGSNQRVLVLDADLLLPTGVD